MQQLEVTPTLLLAWHLSCLLKRHFRHYTLPLEITISGAVSTDLWPSQCAPMPLCRLGCEIIVDMVTRQHLKIAGSRYSKFHFSISPLLGESGSALFTGPTLKASPLARPKAPNLQEHLGLQIRTSLAALGALHQRHNQLLDYYASGFLKWTNLQRIDLRPHDNPIVSKTFDQKSGGTAGTRVRLFSLATIMRINLPTC